MNLFEVAKLQSFKRATVLIHNFCSIQLDFIRQNINYQTGY